MSLMRQMFAAAGGTYHRCPADGVSYMIIGSRCGYCGDAIYPSSPVTPNNFYSRHDPGNYTLPQNNINVFKG